MDETLAIQIQVISDQAESAIREMNEATTGTRAGLGKLVGAMLGATSATRVLRKAVTSYLQTNSELNDKFKAMWTGIGSMLAPALEKIVDFVEQILITVNSIIYAFTGVDVLARGMAAAAGSAKEIKKQLAGFDEINNLNPNSGGGGGGYKFDRTLLNGIEDYVYEIQAIGLALDFALGCILLFSGANIPLGLAMVVGGVVGYKKLLPKWDEVPAQVRARIAQIGFISGITLLGIGLILAFTSQIALGLGLIVAGLGTVYAATECPVDETIVPAIVDNNLKKILGIIAGGLAGLGAVLLFTGNVPLGVGLIAAGLAGGVSLAATSSVGDMSTQINNAIMSADGHMKGFANDINVANSNAKALLDTLVKAEQLHGYVYKGGGNVNQGSGGYTGSGGANAGGDIYIDDDYVGGYRRAKRVIVEEP